MLGNGFDRLFAEVAGHLARARTAAAALALPDATRYVEEWQQCLTRLDDRLHRARVRWVLE